MLHVFFTKVTSIKVGLTMFCVPPMTGCCSTAATSQSCIQIEAGCLTLRAVNGLVSSIPQPVCTVLHLYSAFNMLTTCCLAFCRCCCMHSSLLPVVSVLKGSNQLPSPHDPHLLLLHFLSLLHHT